MAFVCLPPKEVEKFTAALRNGSIDPDKLAAMSSDERREFFTKITGADNAKGVNALFESKLLLKNQQQGFVRWAEKVSGMTPTAKRDILSRIARMDHILNPAEEKAFLKDLASTKLGVNVTQQEAKTIAELSSKVQETATKNVSTPEQSLTKGFEPSKADLEHGYAQYDLQKYISDLKSRTESFNVRDLKTPIGVAQSAAKLPAGIANVSKSLGASLDNSFALRQGLKTLWTNPKVWQKEFRQSFVNIAKGAKNAEQAQREFKAHLMADPLYDQAVKDGLAIIKQEDVFPTSLPGKIPVAGRAFNASEVAYDAFAENLRMAMYKANLRLAEKQGVDIGEDKFGKNVATMVNALTGRGGLGKLEPVSGPINLAFYSLRFLKSNFDTLVNHPLGSGVGGTVDRIRGKEGAKAVSFAQKQAAKTLVKLIGGTAGVLATADALKPGSVEWDPRSSDFGKIRVGDTRFDITGGMGSILTLAARIAKQSTKSTTTKEVTKLNSGEYGSQSEFDVATNFFTNKASPLGGVILTKLKGETPTGEKPTARGEATKLVTPLAINNFKELKKSENAPVLAGVLGDFLGVSTNTYTPKKKPGSEGITSPVEKELKNVKYEIKTPDSTQRDVKLTDDQKKEFVKKSNALFVQSVQKALKDPTYQSLSSEDKKKALSKTLSANRSRVLDEMFPKTKVPTKFDPGYYQYQQQKKLEKKANEKIKAY